MSVAIMYEFLNATKNVFTRKIQDGAKACFAIFYLWQKGYAVVVGLFFSYSRV